MVGDTAPLAQSGRIGFALYSYLNNLVLADRRRFFAEQLVLSAGTSSPPAAGTSIDMREQKNVLTTVDLGELPQVV